MLFILPIRIYYEDTDAGGLVYHANYLKLFERARVEALRQQGFELNRLLSEYDAQFVVHSLTIEYLQPARLDQLLYITTEIEEIGHASLRYNQAVFLDKEDGILSCKANIRLACVNSQFRPKGLPDILFRGIKQ